MDDSDDERLKAEIDSIMTNITETMKKIEELELISNDNSRQNQD